MKMIGYAQIADLIIFLEELFANNANKISRITT